MLRLHPSFTSIDFVRWFEVLRIIEKGVYVTKHCPQGPALPSFSLSEEPVPLSPAVQQCVQRTAGSLRDLQAVFWLQVFSTSQSLSTPAHLRVTPTVRKHVLFLKWVRAQSSEMVKIMSAYSSSPSRFACGVFISGGVFSSRFWVDRFRFQVGLSCLSASVAHWQA